MKTQLQLLFFFVSISFFPLAAKAQGPVNALYFDGVNDYVLFDANNRGISNSVTVEAWIKTSSFKYHWILGKYHNAGDRGYHLIIKDGKAAFAGRDGSSNYRNSGYSNTQVNDNSWHHLAGVCSNGAWLIYVDGVLESQFNSGYSNTDLTTGTAMALGKDVVANNENYNGTMDEVRVWNKALTQDEIRANMCQKVKPAANNLIAYFKFDENAGTTVTDHSSYKINGTFQNMSPATAWVTSGAPVGDNSIYRYGNVWDTPLELVTNIANFSVSKAETGIAGFHLYQISTPPTQTAGLATPQQIKEYYGLFKVGSPDKKYKVWFKQYDLTCGGKLYRRTNNTATPWAAVADTVKSPVMIFYSKADQGEFAAAGTINQSSSMPKEYFTCGGKLVTLPAPKSANGTFLWSSGETTSSIQVSEVGQYSVIVEENGCPTQYQLLVSSDECPVIPNIITPNGDGKNETFMVDGVEPSTMQIEIFNRWGKSIYQSERYDNGWAAEGVPAGFYFYHLKSSRSQNTFKGWLEVIK